MSTLSLDLKDIALTQASHVEDAPIVDDAELVRFDRRIIRKIDIIVLPLVATIYCLAYLDRANIGNARVAGLSKDIGLDDFHYKLAVTITYIPYILIEIPSNLAMKKIGPHLMIPFMITCWGVVTTCQSQVSNVGGLIAVRVFLGLCEGGLFPGIILYLSLFYRRRELQLRMALFFISSPLAGAFSGLLAAAIERLNGKAHLRGWQWIFLLEGLFTVLFGLASFFVLPDSPRTMRTLKEEEKEHWTCRMNEDTNDLQNHKVNLRQALSIFKDAQIVLLLPVFFATGGLGLGLGVFTPTIVEALGYSSTITQLLTVPPYILAIIATILVAIISDRYSMRATTAFVANLPALVGAIIMLKGRGFGIRYAGICLLVMGAYSAVPSLLTWLPNNTAGYTRRATAVASLAVLTSAGGMASTWIYPTSSAPYFEFGAKYNIALIVAMQILIIVVWLLLRRLNRVKKTRPAELIAGCEHLSEEERFEILGDHHPQYKYCY